MPRRRIVGGGHALVTAWARHECREGLRCRCGARPVEAGELERWKREIEARERGRRPGAQ